MGTENLPARPAVQPSRRTAVSAPVVLLGVLILSYAVFFSAYSLQRHATFNTYAADLSYIDQPMWNTLHGRFLERTLGDRQAPRVAEHLEPILLPLSLAFLIWNDVRAILILQTLALALGAVPVFWLACSVLGRDAEAVPEDGPARERRRDTRRRSARVMTAAEWRQQTFGQASATPAPIGPQGAGAHLLPRTGRVAGAGVCVGLSAVSGPASGQRGRLPRRSLCGDALVVCLLVRDTTALRPHVGLGADRDGREGESADADGHAWTLRDRRRPRFQGRAAPTGRHPCALAHRVARGRRPRPGADRCQPGLVLRGDLRHCGAAGQAGLWHGRAGLPGSSLCCVRRWSDGCIRGGSAASRRGWAIWASYLRRSAGWRCWRRSMCCWACRCLSQTSSATIRGSSAANSTIQPPWSPR